jgi:hypothetical protein
MAGKATKTNLHRATLRACLRLRFLPSSLGKTRCRMLTPVFWSVATHGPHRGNARERKDIN